MHTDTFDYIIVGAGSAGAAAAARLSEDANRSVLLLEAGPADKHFFTRMPMGVAELLARGIYIRHFHTEPEALLDQRRIYWPRGWVVGGSSTVNGLQWVHGTPHLFDEWAADGCPGWAFADLKPWFRRIESYAGGDREYRGADGPVTVEQYRPEDPLADAFLDAVQSSGVGARVRDYNAGGLGGSYMQYNTRRGTRCNTRMAYLDPALKRPDPRPNLVLRTQALATRIVLSGKRAVGVQATIAGQPVTLHARREVILCGGTFNSSQLLELSGIGRREVLAAAGTPLVHELPMVGENLSEHVYSPMVYRVPRAVSWNRTLGKPLGQLREGMRWLFARRGKLLTNTITAHAFVPAEPGGTRADVKLQIQQVSSPGNREQGRTRPDDDDAATVASFQIRPHSRGSCHITSRDPAADPRLIARHFSDARDVDACLAALKMSRRLVQAAPLANLVQEEMRPGARCASDEALIAYMRATGATAFHPVGTCRIGTDAAQSVVDPELKVHGIEGLRVADGAVMPTIAATNTNAICIVIGERVADFIRRETA